MKLPEKFINGLCRLNAEEIEEQHFIELYRYANGASKTQTADDYDLLFFVIDTYKDDKIDKDEFKEFTLKLKVEAGIEDSITKQDFKTKCPPAVFQKFYADKWRIYCH